ncbi:phytoene desaturase [Crocinitomicaceae bacterium CZZ-1]|uniref:Phytoene desaturase n=1 Tax=Taishania pollutisoli TaxID=2766479 RepID=A0A8J6P904_9FLAO|nr:phytoene desaturase family protein [Taishania pollutisoli]MBC9812361.1 phytoene desaturase [Taishania pollutisoli]MBX2950337.1 phytoene desaturase [Crocinitomicaceae bacterium]
MSKIAVIGTGFSSLSCAAYLAKDGHEVIVFEKNSTPGGRCRQFEEQGFTFDMGPSWYWMPEVFEQFYNDFGKTTSDFYQLDRLSPSYSIHFGDEQAVPVSDKLDELKQLFESLEAGAAAQLDKFLADAAIKYDSGMNRFVHKPSLSVFEFAKWEIAKGFMKLDLLKAFSKHVRSYFKHPRIIQILEFPVLFLGATPQNIPALYSLMNYADLVGGTWYPQKGMFEIIKAMVSICEQQGVTIHYNATVEKVITETGSGKAKGIIVNGVAHAFDSIVGGADYHHVDQQLLDNSFRNYTEKYWDSREMAPSCLIYYIGVGKKLEHIIHHNLFFDADFGKHAAEIYTDRKWPENPLFYICAPSVTDKTVAPEGCENLFLLIPIAPGIQDSEHERERLFQQVMNRFERLTNQSVLEHIVYKRSYALNDFIRDYNAYKGNAYGLANTLKQTAFLKPKIRNKKLNNVFYTGQLTTPGPGVPPAIISGKVVAEYINKLTTENTL